MKTSSPASPKPPDPKAILLLGPPGGGKTTLALQFPKLYLLTADDNLDGPELYLRKGIAHPNPAIKRTLGGFKKDLDYAYDTINYDDAGKPVDIHNCYDRLMDKLLEAKNKPEYNWVCVDILTMVNEYIIRKVLKLANRGEMEARDWQPFKSKFLDMLVSRIRGMGKNTIMTCHETIETVNDPKQVMVKHVRAYNPSVQGGITDYFGGFFTDVWRCEARPGVGNEVEFFLTTGRTNLSDLKNSMGLPFEVKDPTYAKLHELSGGVI